MMIETPQRIWVVLAHGAPVYCAAWPESCHEHINDAIDNDLPDAGLMVVREYVWLQASAAISNPKPGREFDAAASNPQEQRRG